MKLVILDGPNKGEEFPLLRFPTVIGRSRTADVSLAEDGHLSRRHCAVDRTADGQLWLADLSSNNGTWVGGMRLEGRGPVGEHTVFRIGDTNLCLLADGAALGDHLHLLAPLTFEMSKDTFPAETGQEFRTEVLDPVAYATGKMPAVQGDEAGDSSRLRLTAMIRLAKAAAASRSIMELFETVTDTLLKVLPTDRVAILLVEQSGSPIIPVLNRRRDGTIEERVMVSSAIVDRALGDRIAVLVKDAAADRELSARDSIQMTATRSAMCVPIILLGEVKAMLYLDGLQALAFRDEDLDFVAAIASQVGLAFARSDMAGDLRRASEELARTRARFERFREALRDLNRTG